MEQTLVQSCDMLRGSGHAAACAVQGSRTERWHREINLQRVPHPSRFLRRVGTTAFDLRTFQPYRHFS